MSMPFSGDGIRGVDTIVWLSTALTQQLLNISEISLQYTIENYEINNQNKDYNQQVLAELKSINKKLEKIIDK